MEDQDQHYTLDDIEKGLYRGLLTEALQAANAFTGSEDTYQDLMDRLIAVDEFVRARNEGQSDEALEQEFAHQIGWLETGTVASLLAYAADRVYGTLSRTKDLRELLSALADGGARIDYGDRVFVLTDEQPDSGPTGGGNKRDDDGFVKQPRLAILVKELQTIGVYTDDLILRVGRVFEDKPRKLPYIVVEIPRLEKQVAICDQYGETTFVCQTVLSPDIWASSTKSELKGRVEIEAVRFAMKWAHAVCNLLAFGTSDPTPGNFVPPKKRDIYARSAATEGPPLTLEAILESAIETYEQTGAPPALADGEVLFGPLRGTTTWAAINQAIKHRYRGVDEYTQSFGSLANLYREFDLRRHRPYKLEDIVASAKATQEATQKPPVTTDDGPIRYGPLKGRTSWRNLDSILRRGNSPLVQGCDFHGLPELLEAHGITARPPLVRADILASARQTVAATGRVPTGEDGVIQYGPLKDVTSWTNVRSAIKDGHRGFVRREYSSLSDFFIRNGIKAPPEPAIYTIKSILRSAKMTAEATGRNPHVKSGIIQHGPLKGKDWRSVDHALAKKSGKLKGTNFSSLADLLEKSRLSRKIDPNAVILSAVETLNATGKRPGNDSGLIAHGPLKDQFRWSAVNGSIRNGYRGFPKGQYGSLREFLDAHNIPSFKPRGP